MWTLNPVNPIGRNGFQIDFNPFMRFFGGGGSEVESFDPYAGTGVRGLYKQLGQWVKPQIGQGMAGYPGQRVPGTTPTHQAAFGMAEGMPNIGQQFQDILNQAIPGYSPDKPWGYMEKAGGMFEDLMQPFEEGKEREYWQSAMVEPSMNVFEQQIIPAITEKYGEGAKSSSGLDIALTGAGSNLATNLSAQLADLIYKGREAQRGRRERGIGEALQLANAPTGYLSGLAGLTGMGSDLTSQALNIANLERGMEGERLGAERSRWEESQPWNNPILQQYLGAALQLGPQLPKQAVVEQQPQSLMSSIGPGLGTMMGQGGMGGLLGNQGLGGFAQGLFAPSGTMVPNTMTGQMGMGLSGLLGGAGQLGSAALGGIGSLGGSALGGIGSLGGAAVGALI